MQRGSDSLKKKCSEVLSTGVAPDKAEYGFFSSVGAYTAPQTSQLSPYWSLAPHLGHSPLIKRSGKNMFFSGSKNCSMVRVSIRPLTLRSLYTCCASVWFSGPSVLCQLSNEMLNPSK